MAVMILLIVSLACTITLGGPAGTSQEDRMKTAVAQTVAAANPIQPTQQQPPQPTQVVPPTLAPTLPSALPTLTPLPCNKAAPISETFPDDTLVNPNQNFTKTWRLQNIGTCTWNTNYKVVFSSGDIMGANASYNFSLNLAPGGQMDIAVNLKAPAVAGTYKGIWKLQGDDGQNFGTVWVQIKVAPPAPPAATTVTLMAIQVEGGSVRSNGAVHTALPNVGDTASNLASQVFTSFDMTVIPAGAIIQGVKMYFSGYDTLGNPFGALGCLRLYQQDYGVLDAGDFFAGATTGSLARWCNLGELGVVYNGPSQFGSAIQTKVGSTRFQARFHFNELGTDSDGADDMVRFGVIKMDVTYYVP